MFWHIALRYLAFDVSIFITYKCIICSQEVLSETNGGIIVYTHNQVKATPLQKLESSEYEAIWLKLSHPDPVYDEDVDDKAGGIRVRTAQHPKTIGK